MVIYESRKKTLAEAVGSNGCITENSWMVATIQNLNGELQLYPEEIEFLYNDRGCYNSTPTTLKQGVVISTYGGLKADVMKGETKLGITDSDMIELASGAHVVTITKSGYMSQDLSFVVYDDQITSKSVSLVSQTQDEDETEEEIPTVLKKGPVLSATMIADIPKTIQNGITNKFGWEFTNIGDETWRGRVGIRIKDTQDNILFEWIGNAATQNILAGETKKLWAYPMITGLPSNTDYRIFALLTRS